MEHFIRVVMEKQETLAEGLNDDVFPGSEIMETEQGATVFHSASMHYQNSNQTNLQIN